MKNIQRAITICIWGIFLLVSNPAMAKDLQSSVNPSSDACKSKQRCVVVYVAPWCPACRKSLPLIQEVKRKLNQSQDVGMKIAIGRDRKEKIVDYGMSVGGEVYYDFGDDFATKHRISGVPAWIVLDKDENILTKFSGSPSGASLSRLADYMIEDKLEVSQFLGKQAKYF